MKEGGIVCILTSILRRQNTVAQFIVSRPIHDLCEKSNQRPGAQVARRWWEQTGIDWKKARERVEAAEAAELGTKALMDSESEADNTTDGTARGTGEEESLGASGSSGAGQRTNTLNSIGQGTQAITARSNYKLKRDRV